MHYLVVGSSRGLGAALVNELLARSRSRVTGISRSGIERIEHGRAWNDSGRYRHVQCDIASPAAAAVLGEIASSLPREPLCLVFNAAHIAKDIDPGRAVLIDVMEQINRTGVDGFGRVLGAFQDHLLGYGGVLVGISSHWGVVPPLFLPYAAYPASKSYLNTMLRCLRASWSGRVRVITITIGNIKKEGDVKLPHWFIPTYASAARRIISALLKGKPPRQVHYPLWHGFVYHGVLRFLPGRIQRFIFNTYLKLESVRKQHDA